MEEGIELFKNMYFFNILDRVSLPVYVIMCARFPGLP